MRHSMSLLLLCLCVRSEAQDTACPSQVTAAIAAATTNPHDLARTGIAWEKGLDAALHRGKPILLLQLLGNFDDVYC